MPAVPVRFGQANGVGVTQITVGQQLDLGNLVVVCVGATNQNPATDITVTDNLGNSYSVAVQGAALTDLGTPAHAGNAVIAYTKVTHAGSATIKGQITAVVVAQNMTIQVGQYIPPATMALDQTDIMIGSSNGPSADVTNGTGPVDIADSLLITFSWQGGWCMQHTSLEGDTKRLEFGGSNAPFIQGTAAYFDAILTGPGNRPSTVYVSRNLNGSNCAAGQRSGLSNVLTAMFSAPLARPGGLTSQGAVRPGRGEIFPVYHGQEQVDVSLPYMPLIGSVVLVGVDCGYAPNGGLQPPPTFTVGDAYGNVYALLVADSSVGRLTADAMYMTTVTGRPTTGVFKVTLNVPAYPDPSGAAQALKSLNIGEYFLGTVGTIHTAVYASGGAIGGGLMLLATGNLSSVPAGTLIAGFGASRFGAGAPSPIVWNSSAGYTFDATNGFWQMPIFGSSPPQPTLGTSAWFHKYVPSTGVYDGETITQLTGNTGIIVVGLEFTAIVPLVLQCPVGGGSATVGVPYTATMVVSGGTPPYFNFHLIGGALPPGLTLNATTGVISGTPTTAGVYSYFVEVSDSSSPPVHENAGPCTIVVAGPPNSCSGTIQFKLEKVVGTFKPAPHIPVRGSTK